MGALGWHEEDKYSESLTLLECGCNYILALLVWLHRFPISTHPPIVSNREKKRACCTHYRKSGPLEGNEFTPLSRLPYSPITSPSPSTASVPFFSNEQSYLLMMPAPRGGLARCSGREQSSKWEDAFVIVTKGSTILNTAEHFLVPE